MDLESIFMPRSVYIAAVMLLFLPVVTAQGFSKSYTRTSEICLVCLFSTPCHRERARIRPATSHNTCAR